MPVRCKKAVMIDEQYTSDRVPLDAISRDVMTGAANVFDGAREEAGNKDSLFVFYRVGVRNEGLGTSLVIEIKQEATHT